MEVSTYERMGYLSMREEGMYLREMGVSTHEIRSNSSHEKGWHLHMRKEGIYTRKTENLNTEEVIYRSKTQDKALHHVPKVGLCPSEPPGRHPSHAGRLSTRLM